MPTRNNNEELFAGYASSVESGANENVTEIKAQPIQFPTFEPEQPAAQTEQQRPAAPQRPMPVPEQPQRVETRAERIQRAQQHMGYHKIDVKTLPTGGLFYPEGTEIFIRSARGEEIKHWSTMDDTSLQSVKDCWDFVVERCVTVKMPTGGSWLDLCEIDELYLLLAIREITFINDDNNLMVPIGEGKELPVQKEMIDYIKLPDELMKYYNPTERCFVLKLKTGKDIRVYMPTFGIKKWLQAYGERKAAEQTQFDMDALNYGPYLLPTYRNLTERSYEEYNYRINTFDVKEWGAISWAYKQIATAVNPMIKFTREDGSEGTVSLSFRGGPKAIFSISDPLSILC